MKNKTIKKQSRKQHLYKLLDSFDDKELKRLKKFAELLHKAKKTNDKNLMRILESAPFETGILRKKTKDNIKNSRREFSNGKTYSLEKIKRELGF